MSTPHLIAITGVDGSGKSTLTKNIKQRLESQNETVAAVSIWDGLIKHASLLPLTPKQIDEYLAVLSIPARTHFLLHACFQALFVAFQKKTKWLILDGYWYKYLAAEEVREKESLLKDQFSPKECAHFLPKPDQVFWVEAPLAVCSERKKQFSLFECDFKERNRDHFLEFQSRVLPVHKSLVKSLGAISLDGTLSEKDLSDQCFLKIKRS